MIMPNTEFNLAFPRDLCNFALSLKKANRKSWQKNIGIYFVGIQTKTKLPITHVNNQIVLKKMGYFTCLGYGILEMKRNLFLPLSENWHFEAETE